MNMLKHFVLWVDIPLEAVTYEKLLAYIDWLISKRLKPKTINCHVACISGFYTYLQHEKGIAITNPVKKRCRLRLPKPLPRYVPDEALQLFLKVVKTPRDRALFMLMLRCGLRVAEVAALTLSALDLRRRQIFICNGKGAKDRVVYISNDALDALVAYLTIRPAAKTQKLFLVEKGLCRAQPLSVRGIQKRMEYYARTAGLHVTCHQLRHTMATQLLNADAELATIQDLLGHNWMITMVLCGFWHGASWTFVLWGTLHGLLLCLSRVTLPVRDRFYRKFRLPLRMIAMVRIVITFQIVALLWIFFRANTVADALYMFSHLFSGWPDIFIEPMAVVHGSLGILVLVCVQLLQLRGPVRLTMRTWPFAGRCALYCMVVFSIILFGVDGGSQFIYFQF